MSDLRLNLIKGLACIGLLTLAGCDKLSDVGYQDEPVPKAVASSIGESFTTDSNGNMTMTVRAGSDVILTGKESEKGTDDSGVPLINFTWVQDPSDTIRVQMVNRTSNTATFVAPQVTADTDLHFTLTVSDAKGTADTAKATVTIKNIRDPDHFLQYLGVSDTFPVEVTTAGGIGPNTGVTDPLPVTVTMTKWVTFRDRSRPEGSTTNQTIMVGSPVVVNTSWTKSLGAGAGCRSTANPNNQNPTIQLPIPRLNLDDKLATPVSGFPDAVVLSDVLEPADIDTASIAVRLEVTTSATTSPRLCINNGADALLSGVSVEVESLLASAAPRDSKLAADAYYRAIDPSNAKTTLTDWLSANGFNPNVTGWGADAHAVYTNNYDLGFGRDMYMKTSNCQSGTANLTMDQRIGTCDVAAVVVNYSGVEAAAKGLNPIVAVAMEYSRVPTGTTPSDPANPRYVKFYTFTPDTRTGVYKSVLSVNLDRRGEQYMPQACVVCHGGTPGTVTPGVSGAPGTYAKNGNINATFLPWDLEAFLYSDTDPGFSTKSRNADLRAQYTRTKQEAQFKLLNSGAYLTYDDAASRHALAKELVEGWYHDSATAVLPGLPAKTFNGGFVPNGWMPGVNGNPPDSKTIYSDVFARNCRACHIMQVPLSGDPRLATVTVPVTPATTPPTTTSVAACTNDSRLKDTRVGTAFQAPMGCYWEFVHAPNLANRLSRNQMPFARRTSDRMWVSSSSAPSAGSLLQEHLQSVTPSVVVTTPGTVVPGIAVTPLSADVDDFVTLDGSSSVFGDSLLWRVDACTGTASPGTCTRAMPVVGITGMQAKFAIDGVTTYRVTQTLNGGPISATYDFKVIDKPLTLRNTSATFQIGGQATLPSVIQPCGAGVTPCGPGNGPLAKHTMTLTPSAGLILSPSCATGCSANTTVTITSSTVMATSGTIGVAMTDAGGGTPQTATVSVSITSTFTAQPLILAFSTSAGSPASPTIRANALTSSSLGLLALARDAVKPTDVTVVSVTYNAVLGRPSPAWSFDGVNLSYAPGARFSTHDKSGVPKLTLETFTYELQRPDTGERSTAIATVPVLANVIFQDARGTWSATPCNTCHVSGGSAPNLGASNYGNSGSSDLGLRYGVKTLTTASPSTTVQRPYVDLLSIDQSVLLCYPKKNCSGVVNNHPSPTTYDTTNAPNLITVKQWINDGANDF